MAADFDPVRMVLLAGQFHTLGPNFWSYYPGFLARTKKKRKTHFVKGLLQATLSYSLP